MQLTDRQKREKAVYDELAEEIRIPEIGDEFPIPEREHADFFPYFLKQIGNVRDKSVLEIGSGSGYLSCWLARQSARVAGIDVSEKFVDLARKTAEKNNVEDRTDFQIAVAEKLPFPDASFDIVVGNQVLHHLEIPEAAREIARVLKQGGRAVFCEPIGFSASMEKFKSWTKKTLKHADHRHTPDEKILDRNDFEALQKPFSKAEWRGFQLFTTKLTRLIPMPDAVFHPLLKFDNLILRNLPFLKKGARLAVVTLIR